MKHAQMLVFLLQTLEMSKPHGRQLILSHAMEFIKISDFGLIKADLKEAVEMLAKFYDVEIAK